MKVRLGCSLDCSHYTATLSMGKGIYWQLMAVLVFTESVIFLHRESDGIDALDSVGHVEFKVCWVRWRKEDKAVIARCLNTDRNLITQILFLYPYIEVGKSMERMSNV